MNQWIWRLWLAVVLLPFLWVYAQADSQERLTLSKTSVTMIVGQTAEIGIDHANGTVKADSSNKLVAQARLSNGKLLVTANSAGTANLTVKDKKTKATLSVTVSGAALSASPSSLSLKVGQSGTVTLANAVGTVTVAVANSAIATAKLSGNTITVTGKSSGATQITARDSKFAVVIPVSVGSFTPSPTPTASGSYTLLAWNDLGMHCMDGDYSVFSILPPYNNLQAQLIDRVNNGIVSQGVTLTYEAMADPDGSINSTSATKTNFWQYVKNFFGVTLAPDVGLTGKRTPSTTPQALEWDAAGKLFKAEGIPITPYDDAFRKNTYPMVKVVARDASGNQLAQARVVLPVSDEMSCSNCHAATSGPAARPATGWLTDPNKEVEWKKNILKLHDEKMVGNAAFQSALAAKGYQSSGLLATATSGKPILCAACHASNALPGTGVAGVKPLTEAIHGHHAMVKDSATGQPLDSITNRGSCYQCHPGSETKCLRGAMGSAVDAAGNATMQCQSCHGTMSNVGRAGRVGWLDQPNCQACHHDGKRETVAVSSTGLLKQWLDKRYATNANVPAAGFSLYRFSAGHGGLRCESCHGATHAEYPSSHRNDNVLSQDVQGRDGTVGECASCHKTVPLTANGGPHGMHTVGSTWVSKHESYAEQNKSACAYCHGADYRGSPLARVKVAKSFSFEGKTKTYAAGQQVSCYDCHNGPNGD